MCSAIVNTNLGSQSVFAKMHKRFRKSRVRTFSWRSKVLNQGMSYFIYPAGQAQVSLRNGRYVLDDRKGMPRLFTKWSWLLSLPSSLGLDLVLYSLRWCVRKSNSWLNCTTFLAIFCDGFVAHFNQPDQVVVWDNYYIVKAFALSHCCLNAQIPIPLVCTKGFWSGHQRLNIAGGNGILHSPVHTQVANERLYEQQVFFQG